MQKKTQRKLRKSYESDKEKQTKVNAVSYDKKKEEKK